MEGEGAVPVINMCLACVTECRIDKTCVPSHMAEVLAHPLPLYPFVCVTFR